MTTTGEREKRCVDVCECREEVFDQTRGRGRARARVCVCVDECLCVFVSAMCVYVWSRYTHFQQVSSHLDVSNPELIFKYHGQWQESLCLF